MARTTHALGRALIALLEERAFDAITVQDILDRAGVGRTAFYAHFRNKHDVLESSYDGLFSAFEGWLDRPARSGGVPGARGPRLFPVAELLAHVGEQQALVRALGRDGLLDDTWALLAGYAARTIARRLDGWGEGVPGAAGVAAGDAPACDRRAPTARGLLARDLLARMLAGALVESVRWWQDRPGAALPAEVDAAFHELARGVLQRPR